jgi:hypothetical protein
MKTELLEGKIGILGGEKETRGMGKEIFTFSVGWLNLDTHEASAIQSGFTGGYT